MDLIERIAENVEGLRKSLGISRKVLAEMSGVPYQTLCNLEKRRVGEPRVHTLLNIAGALGTTLDALCGRLGKEETAEVPQQEIGKKHGEVVAQTATPAVASQVISIPLRITVTPENSELILRQDSRIDFSVAPPPEDEE